MGFITGADDKDKANVNWALLGGLLVVGAIFIVCVLFFPKGIWGTLISRGKP